MILYEQLKEDSVSKPLIDLLVGQGYIRRIFQTDTLPEEESPKTVKVLEAQKVENPEALSSNPYIKNGLPIESNFEAISRENFGSVEDRKQWSKTLKEAIKQYGHDDLLEAFYRWAISQSGNLNRKPVSTFLRNAGSYIGSISRPKTNSPSLGEVEVRIAYITDNRVFFTGDDRFILAQLITSHGKDLVLRAFEDFYQDLDDRNIPWAAKNFLQRAEIMIQTIKAKHREEQKQRDFLRAAYDQAASSVTGHEDDEEEGL